MSQREDAETEESTEATSYFSLVVAVTAALCAVVLVGGLLLIERIRVTHEVLLWAPDHVQIGDPIPVRALVFTDLDGAAGGRLVQPEVHLSLRDGAETAAADALAQGVMTPSAFESVSASLRCDACRGTMTLRAEVRDGDILLAKTERTLEFGPSVPAPPEGARIADALQLLQLETDREAEAMLPGLDVRTVGAVCVAEAPCELLVRGVRREIAFSECDNVDLRSQRLEGETRLVEIVIHGPEAHCIVHTEVEADRAASSEPGIAPPSFHRVSFGLQLPVALATARLEVLAEGNALRIHAEPPIGRAEVIVDFYRGDRWIDTRALHAGEELRVDAPEAGIYRVQARADVMSSERAYLRLVDTNPMSAAERAMQEWTFAQREAELIAVGPSASGLASDDAALGQRRRWMRIVTGLGVLSAFLLMLASVVRRGIASEAEARTVMLASGIEGADDEAARRRSRWTVLAYVSAIALAVLLGAAFLVAGPLLLG